MKIYAIGITDLTDTSIRGVPEVIIDYDNLYKSKELCQKHCDELQDRSRHKLYNPIELEVIE